MTDGHEQVDMRPPNFPGSLPEWMVYAELERLGYTGSGWLGSSVQVSEATADFIYRHSLAGGQAEFAGFAIGFLFQRPPGLAFSIVGDYYQHIYSRRSVVHDLAARSLLARLGRRLIFLEERDILRDVKYIVDLGLQGIDHSRVNGWL